MIYQKADIWSNFNTANAAGKSNDVILALGSLIREDKEAVIEAFRQSNIPFPTDADNELLSNAIVQVLRKNTEKSKELLKNLSILIFANKETYQNFFNKKKKSADSGEKIGFLKRLFGKTKNPDGTTSSKAGDFFRNNKEDILGIAGNLLSGIGNRNASSQILNQSTIGFQQEMQRQEEEARRREEEARRRTYTRNILIGVAVVGILGAGIYFYAKRNK
jgi:hypothetical protein